MSLQQLQQEIQRMSDTPQEYENMIAAMQKMNEFAKQTNVKEMQEGGMLQTQEQEGVGAYVPPPKQTFDMTPEKKPVEMQQGGMLGALTQGFGTLAQQGGIRKEPINIRRIPTPVKPNLSRPIRPSPDIDIPKREPFNQEEYEKQLLARKQRGKQRRRTARANDKA